MATGYFKGRRKRLMDKDPHCYWCGIEVIYYPLKKHERMPENYATLDHLKSKYNGKRPDVHMKQKTLVLACSKCNLLRCKLETKALKGIRLWHRNQYPRYLFWLKPIVSLYVFLGGKI